MKPIFISTERGQALILITLAAIGLVAITGLAIDGSAKFSDRRHAQNAADTAVLAGSLANIRGDANWELEALNRALENGYDDNHVTNEVEIFTCDEVASDCGPYAGDPRYIKVIITSNINTYFARLIGISQMQNTVEAIAMSQEEYIGELYGGASIVGLAPDQCKTIWFSGSAYTEIDGGGVFSNSNRDCGVTIQGSTNLNMDGSIEMVATSYTKNGNPPLGGIGGGLHGGADAYDYPPPANMLPNPTCAGNAAKSGSTMSPGSWSGTFPPSGVTTLDPGTYCIDGDFRLNAHDELSGTGVTIYMESGGITWNGGAEINLSAPTSGVLAGLLIYAPMDNSNTMRFNGNAASLLTGTIFMPAAPLVYNGTGNLTPSRVQIIGYTIELTGSNTTSVIYQDADNWDANMPAQVGLMQ
jgi:Flp pilus assembly protein TadG